MATFLLLVISLAYRYWSFSFSSDIFGNVSFDLPWYVRTRQRFCWRIISVFLFTSILVDHRVEVTDTPVDRKNLWKVSAAVKNTFEPLSKVRQHVYNCKHFIYHLTKILRKWAMNTARLPLVTISVEHEGVLNKGWWHFVFLLLFSSNDFFLFIQSNTL